MTLKNKLYTYENGVPAWKETNPFFSFLFVLNSIYSFNSGANIITSIDGKESNNCIDTLEPVVTSVFSNCNWDYKRVSLGEEITLKVKNLHTFLKFAKEEKKNIIHFC